jgi:hypothetical protein
MMMFRIDETRTADAAHVSLEQMIAQQLLGARLGTQLERCPWGNFPEVPNWEANFKRSSSCSKRRGKLAKFNSSSSSFTRLLALVDHWPPQATGQAHSRPSANCSASISRIGAVRISSIRNVVIDGL